MIETVFRAKIWKFEWNIWKIPWADGYFGGIISNYLSADDMYWEFDGKTIKKINPGLFDHIHVYHWKQPSKLSSWDTIYLSKVTKHFPPRSTEGCENDVCLYHKERIKRFQMDSVNYEQLISLFIWRILSVLDERNYTCLFRYPSWHFLWY